MNQSQLSLKSLQQIPKHRSSGNTNGSDINCMTFRNNIFTNLNINVLVYIYGLTTVLFEMPLVYPGIFYFFFCPMIRELLYWPLTISI